MGLPVFYYLFFLAHEERAVIDDVEDNSETDSDDTDLNRFLSGTESAGK